MFIDDSTLEHVYTRPSDLTTKVPIENKILEPIPIEDYIYETIHVENESFKPIFFELFTNDSIDVFTTNHQNDIY